MLSFLLSCAVGGCCFGGASLQPGSIPVLPSFDEETFHREHLKAVRRGRAVLETNIEFFERLLKESSTRWTSERITRYQQELDKWRQEIEFSKKYESELELWENQRKLKPDLETDQKALARIEKLFKEEEARRNAWEAGRIAPMPREVKP